VVYHYELMHAYVLEAIARDSLGEGRPQFVSRLAKEQSLEASDD
jgi:hypothetical protein